MSKGLNKQGDMSVDENSSVTQLRDKCGRRSGVDPRQFSYAGHIPERRSGNDRRCGLDRRKGLDRRFSIDRRCGTDTGKEREGGAEIIEMRSCKERRSGTDRRASFW